MSALCQICEKKRARRHCPGVSGDICPTCCGTAREVTIACAADCEYLREARMREKLQQLDPAALPHADIRLTDAFLREHEASIMQIGWSLGQAMEARGAVDPDAREALAALIQTYRTLDSGLIYEAALQNPYAAFLQDALKKAIEELRQRAGALRDADILGALIFLQRLELEHSNGRPKGRAFAEFLFLFLPAAAGPAASKEDV